MYQISKNLKDYQCHYCYRCGDTLYTDGGNIGTTFLLCNLAICKSFCVSFALTVLLVRLYPKEIIEKLHYNVAYNTTV